MQVSLGEIAGLVPNYHSKSHIAIKKTTLFYFPSAYKSYVYTVVC